jgi:hypothetical protein
VLDVVIGGLGRDADPIADLAGRESLGRESQHIDFAPGQPARVLLPLAQDRSRLDVSHGDEHRTARARLEHTL